jgi:hypothetical protein
MNLRRFIVLLYYVQKAITVAFFQLPGTGSQFSDLP